LIAPAPALLLNVLRIVSRPDLLLLTSHSKPAVENAVMRTQAPLGTSRNGQSAHWELSADPPRFTDIYSSNLCSIFRFLAMPIKKQEVAQTLPQFIKEEKIKN
jgi:hypothetical protein